MPAIKNIWFNTFRKRIEKQSVKSLINTSGINIIFPFYHIVSNDPVPHINHLYPYKNVKAFSDDMDFLLRNFTPLHPDDFIQGRYHPDGAYFMLSFDDGLTEMFDIVQPILLEKGIPATFFVNSDFVDNRDLFYRYKISILIDTFSEDALATAMMQVEEIKFNEKTNPAHYLRQIPFNANHLVDRLAELLRFDFSQYRHTHKPYMSVDQLKQLQQNGFVIGAHSVNHPQFSELTYEEQFAQINISTQWVRSNCNIEKPQFAFPFTADSAAPQLFETMYNDAGVSLSFGTAGIKKQKYPQHIERIPAESKNRSLETIVKSEYHYFIAKKRLGR